MTSLRRKIIFSAAGLVLPATAYCLLQAATYRDRIDLGGTDPVDGLVSVIEHPPGAAPTLLIEQWLPWLTPISPMLARWGPPTLLALTGVIVLYLLAVARKMRRDLHLLQRGVKQLRSPDGRVDPNDFTFNEVRACAGELANISEWLRTEQGRLTEDASRDALTGLPNRRALMDTLAREVSAACRTGWSLSLIMVDLDHFKSLNDTYGHQAGDFVLKRAAERMDSLVRQMDMVARFGGEEFAIVLPRADLEEAKEIAWQLCNALRCDLLMIDQHSVKVSASFGVAELHECGLFDPDALVRLADTALYQAKENGRDTVVAAPKAEEVAGGDWERARPGLVRPGARQRSKKSDIQAAVDADTMALMGSTFSVLQVIPDRHRVAHDILQQVSATLECQCLSLYLFDEQQQGLMPIASVGSSPRKDGDPPVSESLLEWFHARRASKESFNERTVELVQAEPASGDDAPPPVRIPLATHGDLLGVIEIAELPAGSEITARHRGLLSAVCLIGATALRICDLFDAREDRWTRLMEALCRVIQTDKPYKRDHAVSVSKLSVEIAKEIGQTDEQELRLLRVAALVHDIGEIGIPRRIREKKGRLRDRDWQHVRRHTRLSAELLNGVSSMGRLAQIVLHHHEHYDGNGYPDGLVGEQIPLESRIIAVADAYVAMTSDRPYRPRLSDAVAMQRILAGSGSQFDPVVVNAFMQHCSAVAMAEYEAQSTELVGTEQRDAVAVS